MAQGLAYVGGVLDGEGTIFIGKHQRKENKHSAYRGYLQITNTNIPMLKYCKAIIGGRINEQSKEKRCFCLYLSANEIRKVLPQLIPFLIAKKEQAVVMLDFLEKQQANSTAPISEDLLEFYDNCYRRLKSLKTERFSYKTEIREEIRSCSLCGASFTWKSSSPKQIYCSKDCKKKVHWTRSNLRIRKGIPAWNS